MIWIYAAAAVFGGGFILPAILGALDFDGDIGAGGADVDFDTGADMDLGGDVDLGVDAETDGLDAATAIASAVGGIGEWVASLFTFRVLIFTTGFFGFTGLLFSWLDYSVVLTLIFAIAMGLVAGVVNARLFAYLKRSDTSGDMSEHHLRGTLARVILPVGDDRRGRVELNVGGQPIFMSAQPYREGKKDLQPGTRVVVVEVTKGTAYVMTSPELGV